MCPFEISLDDALVPATCGEWYQIELSCQALRHHPGMATQSPNRMPPYRILARPTDLSPVERERRLRGDFDVLIDEMLKHEQIRNDDLGDGRRARQLPSSPLAVGLCVTILVVEQTV